MKKNNKRENAITLVALVITIIILLILATISIQSLTNTGIFEKAKEAKEKMEQAENEQAEMLNKYENTLNNYTQGIKKQSVEEIILNKTTMTLETGRKEKIIATIKPDNVSNKNIIWKSNDENIATVTEGIVTAIAEGTTTITATSQDNNDIKSECTINVEKTKVYLYKNGNKYESITGGWIGKINNNSYGNVTDKGTSLYANCNFNSNCYARWYTTNAISLNKYKKVAFKGKFITPTGTNGVEYSTYGKIEWFVKSIRPDNSNQCGHTTNSFGIIALNIKHEQNVIKDDGNGMQWMCIDGGEYEYMEIPIENINEARYISIECQIGSSFELTECWLE